MMADQEEMELSVTTKMKWYSVNKRLLSIKSVYFFFLAAIGDLLPFIPLYMKQLGLTSVETGIIYGIMPLIVFFVRPLVGILADKLRRHKLILMACCVLTGLFYALLLVIPSKKLSQTIEIRTNIHCNPQDSFISDCIKTEKDGSRSSPCPLVLTDYANLTAGLRNTSIISCLATCQFALPGAYTTQVCFIPGVRPYDERKCVDTWVSSNANSLVKFKFTNMSDIMSREVIRDQTNWEYMKCRDYDLKGVEFNGKFYWQMLCHRQLTLNCVLECSQHIDNNCDIKVTQLSVTFWSFIGLYFLANVAFAPILSLTDSIAYDILDKKRNRWGQQRLWGTVGFSIFAVTSTFLMELLQKDDAELNYSISFYLFGTLCIMSAVASWTLQFSQDLVCSKMMKNILQLFKEARVLVLFLVVTLCGIFNGAIETFLFWYLNTMGGTPIIYGLSLLVNCVSETVLLLFAGKVIKKIGQIPCLYMAFGAYGLRFLGYSLLTNAWYVLPIEILHGVTFGFMWAAVTSHSSLIAPVGMSATVQGFLSGIHFGLAKGVGSLITGKLFEDSVLGGTWTFRVYGISSFVILSAYFVINSIFFGHKVTAIFADVPSAEKMEANEEEEMSADVGDRLLGSSTDNTVTTESGEKNDT